MCGPDCILSTNTSTIDIELIGAKTKSQDRVIGAHFFSPAHIMPLLEIVRTDKTSKQVTTHCCSALQSNLSVGTLQTLYDHKAGLVTKIYLSSSRLLLTILYRIMCYWLLPVLPCCIWSKLTCLNELASQKAHMFRLTGPALACQARKH